MADVDDELLALAGSGSSSSRSSSVSAPRRKRRREVESSDMEVSDEDAEGSEEEEEEVNLYPVEGIYKDEDDRERLLDMPELEREDVLAARRDEITKRRQRTELAAMVRIQQDAGKKKSTKPKVKPRKLKRATAPKKAKKSKKADSDDEEEDNYAEADDNDDSGDGDDGGQDEEESDYERTSTRRGNRHRKATGTTTKKDASLSKLKKRRSKAERKRKGQHIEDETTEDESSEYDEEAQDILTRKAKERDRRERERGHAKREVKASREEERIAQKKEYEMPGLAEVNAARLRRDHLPRMIHRPDWINQLIGKFARVNMQLPIEGGRLQQVYRLVQISNITQREQYYEVVDQYTNVYCTLTYGDDKMEKMPLSTISSSPILEVEYIRWKDRIDRMSPHKAQKLVPSKEATLDMMEDLEAFIDRKFTDQDINDVIAIKKKMKEAYLSGRKAQPPKKDQTGTTQAQVRAGYDEVLMGQMNEKHRKADRERIAEAERRNAALQKKAVNVPVKTPAIPAATVPVGGVENGNDATKKMPTITSLSLAAADIDVDLGDF